MVPSKTTTSAIIAVILLIFSLYKYFPLRSIGYDQVPETNVILDERTNVWHGLSLRKTGIPAAWSNLEAYMKGEGGDISGLNISVDSQTPVFTAFAGFPKPAAAIIEPDFGRGPHHTRFVQPYLDHPFFGALVLSGFVDKEIKTFTDLQPAQFRRASLWLGVVTEALIFTFGWQVFKNPWIGLLGAVIYGSAPTFLLLSRYALLENVLNPLMLLALNLLAFAEGRKTNAKVILVILLAGIAAGLASLTKVTGWSVLAMGVWLLWFWKFNCRQILFFAVPAIVLGSLYFLWGLYLAPNLFVDIFRYQGLDRGFIGSINMLISATRVGILNFPIDGWWIGGFLSLILIPFKKEHMALYTGAFCILLTALFLGGANYPWYFIPMVPFMVLAEAYLIWQVAFSPSFLNIAVFFLFFVSSSFYWGYGVFQASLPSTNYQQPFTLYRLMLLFFLIGGTAWSLVPQMKRFKYFWMLAIVLLAYQLLKWNDQSLLFIVSHWGKLPSMYTPGTF